MQQFEIERAARPNPGFQEIVSGSTPITSFGNPSKSKIATLGINPSSKEFTTGSKNIKRLLPVKKKRLIDYESLEKKFGTYLTNDEAKKVVIGCHNYFENNNWYQTWFKPMEDYVLSQFGASYFSNSKVRACHLDIIQWATDPVWGQMTDLNTKQKLLEQDRKFLEKQLTSFDFDYILLNGAQAINGANNTGVVETKVFYVGSYGSGKNSYKLVEGVDKFNVRYFGWTCNLQAVRASAQIKQELMREVSGRILDRI